MKRILLVAFLVPFLGVAQTKTTATKKKTTAKTTVAKTTTTATKTVVSTITNTLTATTPTVDISAGLKEALNQGITQEVSKLAIVDGFYKNDAVKILFPKELEFIDQAMRKYGMAHLADQGIMSLNRAAEDAVKVSTPIFVDAIKNISITDAKTILLGDQNAATLYLQKSTTSSLTSKLQPVIKQSMSTVGADIIWNTIISKYNTFPLMGRVNPDINSYVADQALQGVFKMIAVEEKKIRTDVNSRSSQLLQQVFALTDNK